jgi:hypothetical protein
LKGPTRPGSAGGGDVEVRDLVFLGKLVAPHVALGGLDQDLEVLPHVGVFLLGEPLLESRDVFLDGGADALVEAGFEVEDLFVEAGNADLAGALGAEAGDSLEEDLAVLVAALHPGRRGWLGRCCGGCDLGGNGGYGGAPGQGQESGKGL